MNNPVFPLRTLLLNLSLLIALAVFPFIEGRSMMQNYDVPDAQVSPKNIELEYEFPDQIKAGEDFIFTIVLKKERDFQTAGNISCKWIQGFTPKSVQIEGADYSIEDKQVQIKWTKLSNSNLIYFSYTVSTHEDLKGVYPVSIQYSDFHGQNTKDFVGIYLFNNKAYQVPEASKPKAKNPISIGLDYPYEVSPEGEYEISINIAKGKNTGASMVIIQLPPESEVEVLDRSEFIYNPTKGKLSIEITSMPPSPDFTIRCQVKNNLPLTAVYPMRASFEIDKVTKASFNNYIFITKNPNQLVEAARLEELKNKYAEELAKVDTTAMFSKLDKILNAWTTSTSGTAQNNVPLEEDSILPNNKQAETNLGSAANLPQPETAKQIKPGFPLDNANFFSVQLVASEIQLPELENQINALRVKENFHEHYDGEIYRYTVGEFQEVKEAGKLQKYLVANGFSDAFVVKYENGQRTKAFY